MAENVVTLNAQGEEEVHENVEGVELKTESGSTATFIHDAEIRYLKLPDRPFGDIPIILAETEVAFGQDADFSNIYSATFDDLEKLVEGQTYKVAWDGTEYTCVATPIKELVESFNTADVLCLGNVTLFWGAGLGEDTGEPFFFGQQHGRSMFNTASTETAHTVSIIPVNSVQKLNQKYLPDGLATEEFVKSEIAKIEIPEGGGSSGGTSGGVSSWNDLTDKPFGEETVVAIAEQEHTFAYDSTYGAFAASVLYGGTYPLAFLAVGDTCVLVWDGTEYKVTVWDASSVMPGYLFVGNGSALGLSGNGEPFIVAWNSYGIGMISLVDTAATTHTVSMYCNVIKHLDNKYLDFVDKAETMGTELVAEQAVEGFALGSSGFYTASLEQTPPLVAGERYKVIWDGEVYDYAAFDMDGGVAFGNIATYIPFAIGFDPFENDMDFTTATSGASHRIGIYHVTGETCKINPKCLPKIAAIADLTAAPTAEDFNALLAALRSAGYLATE